MTSSAGQAPNLEQQRDTVQAAVTRFLARYLDDVALLGGDSLLTAGILDSLATVELIAFLEREFQIAVIDDDLQIENFDSISAIVALVERKRPR